MRAHRYGSARAALGVVAVMVAGAACADKAFTPEKAALNPRMKLQVTASTAQQVAPTARYIWVAVAGIIPDGDTALLSMANVPVTGGTQTITLDVDISRCLAANAAQGRGGCSIIVGAVLRSDSITMNDSSDTKTDPFMRAFDYVIIGPFDVSSGRVPTIPPIDLSLSRFSVFDWEPDEALRLGAAHHAANSGGPLGRVLTGTASGPGNPVLYTVTTGTDFASFIPNQQTPPQNYPALAIFENGSWRRVLATTAPALNTGSTSQNQGFADVTALATNDVYVAAASGLYKFDGAAFSKIAAVSDTLFAVASAPTAGGGRVVIAGGPAGTIWIGYGTTWQKYSTGSASRFDGVCITGPSEAFASSSGSGAVYRFNGTSWTSVPTPSTASKVDLQCPGPGQAYVTASGAGFYRWTVSGWAAIPATGLSPSRQVRMAAVSATEMYAAGDSGATDRAFYRFDGASWTEIGRRRFAQGSSRVWADPRGGAAYALSSFGRLEKVTPTPTSTTVLSYQPALRDVVMTSANSAFAVGWNNFLARWDGVRWTVDASPAGTPSVRILQGVWSDGPSNAWAVGTASTILRFNGSSWSVLSDINRPIATPDGYNAVWGTGSDVWIAGDGTLLHCRSVTSCTVETSGGAILYSIWGSSATNVFAVGAGGRILRYNGTSWTQMTSPTGRNLARVAGSGPSDVWAVGDSVLVHFDGTQWANFPMTGDLMRAASRVPSFQQGTFQLGLWVRGPKEAYVGGDNGVIVRWDGSGWQQTRDGFFFGRRVLSISGAAGCAMAVTEAQSDLPAPTMWRGVGSNGCLNSAMGAPASWP